MAFVNWRKWSMFLPRTTVLILQDWLPKDIARIVVEYSEDEHLCGFDPYGYWVTVPEYGRNGSYGHLPHVPVVDTGLPLF